MSAAKITRKWPPKPLKTWVNTVFDDLRKEVPKGGRVFVFAFQLPDHRAVIRMSQFDRKLGDADYHEKLLAETEKKPGYICDFVPEVLAKAWRNGKSRAVMSLWKGTKMVRAIECSDPEQRGFQNRLAHFAIDLLLLDGVLVPVKTPAKAA